VTPWVHLGRADQICIYESIRDARAEMPDMAYREPRESRRWEQGESNMEAGSQDSRAYPSGLGDVANGAPWVDPADMRGGGPRENWNQNAMYDGGNDSGWGNSGWGENNDSGWGGSDGGGD
jgi:hypothetical protein